MAEDISGSVAWRLRKAIKGVSGGEARQSGTARVTRRDSDGTVWLRMPGSTIDTPVTGAVVANVDAGDVITYAIQGGRVSIEGNASDPSVGESVVGTVRKVAARAASLASSAKAIAEATGQHFWYDDNGAHISTTDRDPAGARNAVWNSLGMLFRSGTDILLAIVAGDDSGVDVYDGGGNEDENVVASFRGSGARVGYEDGLHALVTAAGQFFRDGLYNLLSITPAEFKIDTFTGDGTTVTFTLSATPALVVRVEVGGAYTDAYTRSGSALTLATAPATGAEVKVTYKTSLTTLTIYDGGAWTSTHDNVVALFNEVGARIGRKTGRYVRYSEDGMEMLNRSISMAKFGDSARIGTLTGGHVTIDSDSIDYSQGNDSAFAVETVGDPTDYQLGTVFSQRACTGTHVYEEPYPIKRIESGAIRVPTVEDVALFTDDGSGGYLNICNGEADRIRANLTQTEYDGYKVVGYVLSYTQPDDFTVYLAEYVPIYDVKARIGRADSFNTTVQPDSFGVSRAEDRLFNVSSDGHSTNVYMGGSTLPAGFKYTDNQVFAIYDYLTGGCTVSGHVVLDPDGGDTTWRLGDDGYGFLYDSDGVLIIGPGTGEIEYLPSTGTWEVNPSLTPQSEVPGAPVSIDMGNVGVRAVNGTLTVDGNVAASTADMVIGSAASAATTRVARRTLGTVTLHVVALRLASALANNTASDTVLTVPDGFRPSETAYAQVIASGHDLGSTYARVGTDGAVTIRNQSGASIATSVSLAFTLTYVM